MLTDHCCLARGRRRPGLPGRVQTGHPSWEGIARCGLLWSLGGVFRVSLTARCLLSLFQRRSALCDHSGARGLPCLWSQGSVGSLFVAGVNGLSCRGKASSGTSVLAPSAGAQAGLLAKQEDAILSGARSHGVTEVGTPFNRDNPWHVAGKRDSLVAHKNLTRFSVSSR